MPGQGQADRDRAHHVDGLAGAGGARLGNVPQRDDDDRRRQRQVDVEHQPPGDGADQPAAEERPDRGGDAAEPGPGADSPRAVIGGERRLQDRQAARGEQRRAHALQRAGGDQDSGAGRQAADERGDREPYRADHEDLPAAVRVTERAAEQQHPGQGERVAVHDPLHAGDRRVEILADRGQRDADDGRVERGDARAEDGGRQHPAAGGTLVRQAGSRHPAPRSPDSDRSGGPWAALNRVDRSAAACRPPQPARRDRAAGPRRCPGPASSSPAGSASRRLSRR